MPNAVLRRRKLGRTSVREIVNNSKAGLIGLCNGKNYPRRNLPPKFDTVFRWGCTADIDAKHIINGAGSIHVVSDKIGFRKLMEPEKLGPPTYTAEPEGGWKYPLVVRPGVHHQGRHLYVCQNKDDLDGAITACVRKAGTWYASPLINKVAEYRVFVVSGRAVCVARKHPGNPDQVAWNVAQGGRFENVRWDEWPLKAVKTSIKAFGLSGLDFGGVDVMVDNGGNCYVLEINSAPSLTSPYRQRCFAKAFDYILAHGEKTISLQEERGNYKKFIHPAITEMV